jgi:hypothetical protein
MDSASKRQHASDHAIAGESPGSQRPQSHVRALTTEGLREHPCVLRVLLTSGQGPLEGTLRFIAAYLRCRYSQRSAERIAVAVYELVSNGVDYARVGTNVTVEIRVGRDEIVALVSNVAIEARLDMLRHQLDLLTTDPMETYKSEMTASLEANGARAKLGLARICHEAKLELRVHVDAERVTIAASCRR